LLANVEFALLGVGLESQETKAPTRRCQRRRLRWTVGIGPGPIRRFGMSALLLLQQRNWRSNLDAMCQPHSRPANSGLSHLTKS